MPDNLVINFSISGQDSYENGLRTVFGSAMGDVGFRAATNRQRALKRNLKRDFAPVVEKELQEMATKISRMAVGLSNPNNPPPGTLRISGRVAKAMVGRSGPMTISSMTGTWRERNKTYMKYKVKKYRTRRWFKNTGRLQNQLASVGTYRAAYGPLRVSFTPTSIKNKDAIAGTLGRSRGGQSTNIQIGKLVVEPLRRLRAQDLPLLGQKATYRQSLMSPLADSVERKLTGRSKTHYRPVIEPFLSYYLTRKIPNAVFLKLEDSYGLS